MTVRHLSVARQALREPCEPDGGIGSNLVRTDPMLRRRRPRPLPSGVEPGPGSAGPVEERERVDRGTARVHLEVQVGTAAPGVARVADVADDVPGAHLTGGTEAVEVAAEVPGPRRGREPELLAAEVAGGDLDLAAGRRPDGCAAWGEQVGAGVGATAAAGEAPVVEERGARDRAHEAAARAAAAGDGQLLADPAAVRVGDAVGRGDRGRRHAVAGGDAAEGLARLHHGGAARRRGGAAGAGAGAAADQAEAGGGVTLAVDTA